MKKPLFHSLIDLSKWTLPFLMTMFFSTTAFSQKLSIGPKVGFLSSTPAGDDVPADVESISGFTGGIFLKYTTGDVFAIQPEILYTRKGGYYNEGLFSYELNVDYLEIPLLLKAQIPVSETVFPFIYVGPYAAFELNNREQGDFFFVDYESTAAIRDFDAGAVFGAGMDVELNSFYLGFDARYGIGMVNIYEPDDDGDQADIKNRSLSFMLGLGVNLDQ